MDSSIFKNIYSKKFYTRQGFQSLTREEKQLVIVLSLSFILFLYYFLIWSPLSDGVDTLQDKITQDQKLLVSLVQAHSKISKEKNNTPIVKNTRQAPLLTVIDEESKKNAWRKYLINMKQIDNQVEVAIPKINFDDFISGLENLSNNAGANVEKVDLLRLNSSDAVQASVLLQ